MTNLAHKILDYSEHLEAIGYAGSSIRAHNSRLRGFSAYIKDHGYDDKQLLDDQVVLEQSFDHYAQFLLLEGVKSTSLNSIHATISSFCVFLGMRRLSSARHPEIPSRPRPLDFHQVAMLEEAIQEESNLRNKAIATIMLKAGLRPTECAALNIRDICVNHELCFISTGSAARNRVMAFDEDASMIVLAHMRNLHPVIDQPLFTSKQRVRISMASIDLILKNIARRVRLEISAQILRETFIANLVTCGLDIATVAALAGTNLDSLKQFYPQPVSVTPMFIPKPNRMVPVTIPQSTPQDNSGFFENIL